MSYSVEILREFTKFLDKSAMMNSASAQNTPTTTSITPPGSSTNPAPRIVATEAQPRSTPSDDTARNNVQTSSSPPPKPAAPVKENQFVQTKKQK